MTVVIHKRQNLPFTMKNYILISLFLTFWFAFISCQRDTEPLSSSDDHFVSDSQFPIFVGSWWKYEIIDTLFYTYTGEMDVSYGTLTVTIKDSTILPNGQKAFIWEYKYKDHIDTLYSSFSSDTLIFYKKGGNLLLIRSGFLLPLKAGNQWQLSKSDYRVFLCQIVRVPVGTFENVFEVRERERQGNAVGWNSYFIAPGVGIIRYKYGTFVTLSEINHKIEWKLLKYYLTG